MQRHSGQNGLPFCYLFFAYEIKPLKNLLVTRIDKGCATIYFNFFSFENVQPSCHDKSKSLLYQFIKRRTKKGKVWRITYLWALISLGSKGRTASQESHSSVTLPRFLSLFSSLRYIFIICFSCSDWTVTWHPYMGLVTSPLTFWVKSYGNNYKQSE